MLMIAYFVILSAAKDPAMTPNVICEVLRFAQNDGLKV